VRPSPQGNWCRVEREWNVRMRSRVISWVAILGLLFSPALGKSQTIRGVITERDGAQPIPGAVVLLIDSTNNPVVRALTNERGEYRLQAPKSGTYRLRALRIGFLPTTTDPVNLRMGEDVTQSQVLASLPLLLDTVRVIRNASCRMSHESSAATFIWEQARTALTAAQLTARSGMVSATVMRYERSIDPVSNRIKEQSSAIDSGRTERPWKSLTIDSLRRIGYVVTDRDNSVTYYAPDLDALLSEAWIADHCFRVIGSPDQTVIGLAFEPTRSRSRVPDITGVLWLDRGSSELRRMQFRYVNVLPEQERHAGGEMEFLRLRNGGWAISRWQIRTPVLLQRHRRFEGPEIILAGMQVTGGELVLAQRGTDTLWSSPPWILAGAVVDSASMAPLRNARITLSGTALQAFSDERGRFAIPSVLAGDYTLEVRTASLDSIGGVSRWTVAFTDTNSSLTYRVPSATDVVAALCGKTKAPYSHSFGILKGIVRSRTDSVALPKIAVVAEWSESSDKGQTFADSANKRIQTRADSRGIFLMCGLPLEARVAVRAIPERGSSAVAEISISPHRRLTAAELLVDESALPTGILKGIVLTDSTEQPISDAQVMLPSLQLQTVTDQRGSFRFSDVRAGEHELVVRRMGFGPLATRITIAANQSTDRRILLPSVVILDSVVVRANALLPSFEEHRAIGLGHFITRAELEKREGGRTADVLAQVAGAGVVRGKGSYAWVASTRGPHSLTPKSGILDQADVALGAAPGACYAQVYLDHALVYSGRPGEGLFSVNSLPVSAIEAIEYYAGPARTPLKYQRLDSNCGVLVIWTRRTP
jgi:hypothetical protein